MIRLTKLNGSEFVLNCNLIETIMENPDTTIHGPLYIVAESKEEVVRRAIEYHRSTFSNLITHGMVGPKPAD